MKAIIDEKIKARDGWDTIPALRNNMVFEIKSPDILSPRHCRQSPPDWLRQRAIANMGLAEKVDCPVIPVAESDRGGVLSTVDLPAGKFSQSSRHQTGYDKTQRELNNAVSLCCTDNL